MNNTFIHYCPQCLTPHHPHCLRDILSIQRERPTHDIWHEPAQQVIRLDVFGLNATQQELTPCGDSRSKLGGVEGDVNTLQWNGGLATGKYDGFWQRVGRMDGVFDQGVYGGGAWVIGLV